MRVGFVRGVALGTVALVGLGLAACEDSPTDFDPGQTAGITTNPSVMVLPAGITTLLESRTVNEGNEPTWEEISTTIDASCGPASVTVEVAESYEPSIQPPGQFDVTGGTTLGETCIQLSGGGASATVEVTIVGENLDITGEQEFVNLNSTLQLSADLLSADGSPVSPFDETTDLAWSSDANSVFTVDQTGLVEAVGVGDAVITATWTGGGVSVSDEVTLATNQPTLNITNAPDEMVIFTMADLDAELVNPTDPPADFGPFDQSTDVEWSSSDTDVLTVDAVTGEVTAEGPGTATITATWTGNDDIFDEATITVTVPPPVLISGDASADARATVSLTGTGFIDGGHSIFVDGAMVPAALNPTIVDAMTATFDMCPGAVGDVEVTVGTAAAQSNALTVTRTSEMVEPDEAPGGDAPGDPNPICGLPFNIENGSMDFDTDNDDWFSITVDGEADITIELTWNDNSVDFDILVVDGAFTAFVCTDGATAPGAEPVETSACHLPEAGEYLIWIDHFGPAGTSDSYQLSVF